jgi:uncharacterized protein (TIGR00251 family)
MRVTVHLTPQASSNKIEGWARDENDREILRVKVTAFPEEGKANEALIRLLSKALGIPQSRIFLVSGESSRIKQVEIPGEMRDIKYHLQLNKKKL